MRADISPRDCARGRVCCPNTAGFQSQPRWLGPGHLHGTAAPPGGWRQRAWWAPAQSPVGPGGGAQPKKALQVLVASHAERTSWLRQARRAQGRSGRGGMFWKASGGGGGGGGEEGEGSRCSLAGGKDRGPTHLCGAGPATVTLKPSPSAPAPQPPAPPPAQGWAAGLEGAGQRRVNSAGYCWPQPHK